MGEGEETDLDYRNSKKHWKRHENNDSEKTLDLEPKAATDQSVSKKNEEKQSHVWRLMMERLKKNRQRRMRNVNIKNMPRLPSLLKHSL